MRHRKKFNHLGRKKGHRSSMLANMACSLIEHKRINTTLAKAKALKKFVEPLITKSKSDTTHNRRIVFSRMKQKNAVAELFRDVAVKVADRPGGYTRIIRLGNRLGDNAEMAMIELVDYNDTYVTKKKKTTRRSRRGKKSEYAIQLMEKQKAKYIYGILERQFRNLFKKASRSKGVTGEVLLQLCESRLDNTVYRMGLSKTRAGARQLVSHRHITVNSRIVNIPSFILKAGDIVGVREKSKSLNTIIENNEKNNSIYEWLNWNDKSFEGTFIAVPKRDQIPENIKEQLIVELYSK